VERNEIKIAKRNALNRIRMPIRILPRYLTSEVITAEYAPRRVPRYYQLAFSNTENKNGGFMPSFTLMCFLYRSYTLSCFRIPYFYCHVLRATYDLFALGTE